MPYSIGAVSNMYGPGTACCRPSQARKWQLLCLIAAVLSFIGVVQVSAAPTTDPVSPLPTIRVGATNFAEQVVVAELYAQVLEQQGHIVERRFNQGARET